MIVLWFVYCFLEHMEPTGWKSADDQTELKFFSFFRNPAWYVLCIIFAFIRNVMASLLVLRNRFFVIFTMSIILIVINQFQFRYVEL
jgi:hypothetical protein